MKIELKQITVRELYEGYKNNLEEGVIGYGGRLNIRPKYQREFVYKDTQRNAVIESIRNEYPLNVMYWVVNNANSFEVLDGQQRTISICEYIAGAFSINYLYFHSLTDGEMNQILDYNLMVYFCEGTDKEKLDWFKIINIAGEKLTDQELRNAVYTGEWLTDAKRYFSKTGCTAYQLASDYITGVAIRQEYLETAISWISEGSSIEDYMSKNQHEPNANELWLYFRAVIEWVKTIFTNYRKEMKSVEWGVLYNRYKDEKLDANKLEKAVQTLMQDEDVSNKKGIYEYVLNGNERALSVRTFTQRDKRTAFEKQDGVCCSCGKQFGIDEMEADHITPWSKGGKTIPENCQMLCKACNRVKSAK